MWQMGGPGPFLGQVHHFVKFNPGKSAYAEERYAKEAKRLWGVVDRRLAEVEYVAGDFPSPISPSGLGSRALPGRPWISTSIPTSGAGMWRSPSGLLSNAAGMC
jgi:hypothetical protein